MAPRADHGSTQMRDSGQTRELVSKIAGIGVLLIGFLLAATLCFGGPANSPQIPNIFRPQSTPADSIFRLSMLVLTITGAIFAVVFCLLVYAIAKYRRRGDDDGREPPQVYGSNQVELAWTVIPVLIVLVLFLVHGARDPFHSGCSPAARCDRSRRDRPSILVGVPLSRTGYGHGQ